MAAITRDDVRKVLGSVDDTITAEMVATGASPEELAEAHSWLTNDEALMNSGHALPSGRVQRLVTILQAVERERTEPDR